MELRLVCDPLLRSRMSPLLSFLAPSIPPPWRATAASPQVRLPMPKPIRYRRSGFHTTARQRAPSSSNEADLDFLEDKPSPKPEQKSRSPFTSRRRSDDVLRNQINSLLGGGFDNPNQAKRNPADAPSEPSDVMIETAFQNSMRNRTVDRSHQEIAQKMQFPSRLTPDDSKFDPFASDIYGPLQSTQKGPQRAKRTVRSRPAVGRTIEVRPDKGVDVGRALRSLEIVCSVNRVKLDQSRQRFHERPGMKRKRLKRERWRKMFKESFKATVSRVREMRRKGW